MTIKKLLLATTILPVLTALPSEGWAQEAPDTSTILLTQAAPAPAAPEAGPAGGAAPAGEERRPRRERAADPAEAPAGSRRRDAGAAEDPAEGRDPARPRRGQAQPAEGAAEAPARATPPGDAPARAGGADAPARAQDSTSPGRERGADRPAAAQDRAPGAPAATQEERRERRERRDAETPAGQPGAQPGTAAQEREQRRQERGRARDEAPGAAPSAGAPATTPPPASAQPAPSPAAPSSAQPASPPAPTRAQPAPAPAAPSSAQPATPPATPPASAQPATPPATPPASAQPATPPATPPASAQPATPPAAQPGVAQPNETPETRRERRLREAGGRQGTDAPAAGQPGGERIQELRLQRRERSEDGGRRVIIEEPGNRTIVRENGRVIIRHDETERLRRSYRDVQVERRGDDRVTIARRPNGVEVITYQDDDGTLLRRVRRDRSGRETILIDNREEGRDRGRDRSRRVVIEESVDLAPVQVRIPREKYVVEVDRASRADIEEAFTAPPVERIERSYTLDEVRQSPNLRERMRRVDLDTVTFDFGSWELTADQSRPLEEVAAGLKSALDKNPDEIFLVEGHTDAVGPDVDNLTLSDRRAENVALVLSEEFGVPAENLTTQGYGEQYLKINTQEPERENRRVTLRRITPLLKGASASR